MLRISMLVPTLTRWRARLVFTGIAGALAIGTLATLPSPAQARVWVTVGVPGCCYYAPDPYYGYPPPPYAYAPPPNYYYPPPPAGYPPAGGAAPSAYTPGYPPQAGYPPAGGAAPMASAPAAAGITYTNKPAFTNSAGQTCREYKTTDTTAGHPVDIFGTACKQADGQWHVVN
jgi:hypothetical protein